MTDSRRTETIERIGPLSDAQNDYIFKGEAGNRLSKCLQTKLKFLRGPLTGLLFVSRRTRLPGKYSCAIL